MSFFRNNGLTIVLLGASVATIIPMTLTGFLVFAEQAARHHAAGVTFLQYLSSGHFLSALFENWESEFLQMSAYVCLTAYFFQRGSAESKDPDALSDKRQRDRAHPLYAYSLGIVLATLFLASFALHLVFSARAAGEDALRHGGLPVRILEHVGDAEFWFESFQNWQSEFLSTMVLVVLSIFLRYRGSPESKPVNAPNSQTGTSD